MAPQLAAPPLAFRLGFSAVFAGGGYITSCGDYRNGSGTTTAWSLAYLFFYTRQAFHRPRNLWSLGLTFSTMAVSAIHGMNYFVFQDFGKDSAEES